MKMNGHGARPRIHSSETIDTFSEKWPQIYNTLLDSLQKYSLWKQLSKIAFDRNVLKLRSDQSLDSLQSCKSFFNELMRIRCTLKDLIDCLDSDDFDEAKAILGVFKKIRIVKEPCAEGLSINVRKGDRAILQFEVSGFPRPSYQWFFDDKPIEGACYDIYYIENFSEFNEGTYWCEATQSARRGRQTVTCRRFECLLFEYMPSFLNQLNEKKYIAEGYDLPLSVVANDKYSGPYVWTYNNQIIPDANVSTLVLKSIRKENEGVYRCTIKNKAGECSCKFVVSVESSIQRFPRMKVAILIGNSNYVNLKNLETPPNDVELLGMTLELIGFLVIKLFNRTKEEMMTDLTEISKRIIDDSFILFYFNGHGFELRKNKFFIPTNCPPSGKYRISDCISEEFMLENFISCKPKLLVTILDMCLKIPDKDENPLIFEEKLPHHYYDSSPCSLVQACSTTDYQASYEKRKEPTSLYCRCLCQYLVKELQVSKCFENAHELFAKECSKGGFCQQKPNLSSNDHRGYSLHYPMHP